MKAPERRPIPAEASGFYRVLRYFWPEVRKEGPLVAASLTALLGEVGFRLLEPWPLKYVFDEILTVRPSELEVGSSPDPLLWLTVAAALYLLFAGFRSLTSYGSSIGFALVGNRALCRIRAKLFRHLQILSLSFHSQSKIGDLVTRVVGDIGLLKDIVVTAFLPLLGKVLIMVGMVSIMLFLNWKLALLAIAVLPLFSLRTVSLSRRIKSSSRTQRKREGAMAATAAESIGAIDTVQALSLEDRFSQRFASQNQKSLGEGIRTKRLSLKLERTVDVAVAAATAAVIWYGAQLVIRGELSPGGLVVFLQYLKSAFKPAKDFAKYTGRLARATAAGERVMEVLSKTPRVQDRPDALTARNVSDLELRGVHFGYRSARTIVAGIDLHLGAGRTVALVGPSGAGKSTIARLLLRLYDPTQGHILLDGRDARSYSVRSLRRQFSVVLQDSLLFAATIRDNIAATEPEAAIGEIEEAAQLANAHEFISNLPEGYHTLIAERGVTLSRGQRQRIAIARAALRRSSILILDEPTSGLDESNCVAVVQALARLSRQRTTLWITHDLRQAVHADEICYLDGGRIVERGTHEDLLQRNGLYAYSYRIQSDADGLAIATRPEDRWSPRLGVVER